MDVTEDVGLGRSGRRVNSQCPKDPSNKTKGKKSKIEKESDLAEGNSASASFNTETDIMSQDDESDIPQKRKGRNMHKRKFNKSNAPNNVDNKDECNHSEGGVPDNEEKHKKNPGAGMKLKKRVQEIMINAMMSVMLSTEEEETSLNDKDEMPVNQGNGNGSKVDTTGKQNEDKGNILTI